MFTDEENKYAQRIENSLKGHPWSYEAFQNMAKASKTHFIDPQQSLFMLMGCVKNHPHAMAREHIDSANYFYDKILPQIHNDAVFLIPLRYWGEKDRRYEPSQKTKEKNKAKTTLFNMQLPSSVTSTTLADTDHAKIEDLKTTPFLHLSKEEQDKIKPHPIMDREYIDIVSDHASVEIMSRLKVMTNEELRTLKNYTKEYGRDKSGVRYWLRLVITDTQLRRPRKYTETGYVPMYPYHCHEQKESYLGDVTATAQWWLEIELPHDVQNHRFIPWPTHTIREILIGQFPVMIFSNRCNLSRVDRPECPLPPKELMRLGVDPHDFGGYLDLGGSRWVLIPQEEKPPLQHHDRIMDGSFSEFIGFRNNSSVPDTIMLMRGTQGSTEDGTRGRYTGKMKSGAGKGKQSTRTGGGMISRLPSRHKKRGHKGGSQRKVDQHGKTLTNKKPPKHQHTAVPEQTPIKLLRKKRTKKVKYEEKRSIKMCNQIPERLVLGHLAFERGAVGMLERGAESFELKPTESIWFKGKELSENGQKRSLSTKIRNATTKRVREIQSSIKKRLGKEGVLRLRLFVSRFMRLPVQVIFQALGVSTIPEMVEMIRGSDTDEEFILYASILVNALMMDEGCNTRKHSLKRIGDLWAYDTEHNTVVVQGNWYVTNRLFPYVNRTKSELDKDDMVTPRLEQARFLAYKINRLLHMEVGLRTECNIDSMENRKFITPNEIFSMNAKIAFEEYLESIRERMTNFKFSRSMLDSSWSHFTDLFPEPYFPTTTTLKRKRLVMEEEKKEVEDLEESMLIFPSSLKEDKHLSFLAEAKQAATLKGKKKELALATLSTAFAVPLKETTTFVDSPICAPPKTHPAWFYKLIRNRKNGRIKTFSASDEQKAYIAEKVESLELFDREFWMESMMKENPRVNYKAGKELMAFTPDVLFSQTTYTQGVLKFRCTRDHVKNQETKSGVKQLMSMHNLAMQCSLLARSNFPSSTYTKTKRRKKHPSQFGVKDPNNTPHSDGSGITKHASILASYSVGATQSESRCMEAFVQKLLRPYREETRQDCVVLLNGVPIGVLDEKKVPSFLHTMFMVCAQSTFFPALADMGITHFKNRRQIELLLSAGRTMHWVLRVDPDTQCIPIPECMQTFLKEQADAVLTQDPETLDYKLASVKCMRWLHRLGILVKLDARAVMHSNMATSASKVGYNASLSLDDPRRVHYDFAEIHQAGVFDFISASMCYSEHSVSNRVVGRANTIRQDIASKRALGTHMDASTAYLHGSEYPLIGTSLGRMSVMGIPNGFNGEIWHMNMPCAQEDGYACCEDLGGDFISTKTYTGKTFCDRKHALSILLPLFVRPETGLVMTTGKVHQTTLTYLEKTKTKHSYLTQLQMATTPQERDLIERDVHLDQWGVITKGSLVQPGVTLMRAVKITKEDLEKAHKTMNLGHRKKEDQSDDDDDDDDDLFQMDDDDDDAEFQPTYARWSVEAGLFGQVKSVKRLINHEGVMTIVVRIAQTHKEEPGCKIVTGENQKGVYTKLIPFFELPVSASGASPQIIRNKHSLPSRRTPSTFLEMQNSKMTAHMSCTLASTGQRLGTFVPFDQEQVKTTHAWDGRLSITPKLDPRRVHDDSTFQISMESVEILCRYNDPCRPLEAHLVATQDAQKLVDTLLFPPKKKDDFYFDYGDEDASTVVQKHISDYWSKDEWYEHEKSLQQSKLSFQKVEPDRKGGTSGYAFAMQPRCVPIFSESHHSERRFRNETVRRLSIWLAHSATLTCEQNKTLEDWMEMVQKGLFALLPWVQQLQFEQMMQCLYAKYARIYSMSKTSEECLQRSSLGPRGRSHINIIDMPQWDISKLRSVWKDSKTSGFPHISLQSLDRLEKKLLRWDSEVVYDAQYGRRCPTRVCIGYQHIHILNKQVGRQLKTRSDGPVNIHTGQPVRSGAGNKSSGSQCGYMEGDIMLQGGGSYLFYDRMVGNVDPTRMYVCDRCNSICWRHITMNEPVCVGCWHDLCQQQFMNVHRSLWIDMSKLTFKSFITTQAFRILIQILRAMNTSTFLTLGNKAESLTAFPKKPILYEIDDDDDDDDNQGKGKKSSKKKSRDNDHLNIRNGDMMDDDEEEQEEQEEEEVQESEHEDDEMQDL